MPKLEAFRKDLIALFKKHDVAGFAVAASPTHTIHSLNLEATWNCMTVTDHPAGGATLQFKTTHLPEAERQPCVNRTVTAVMALNDAAEGFLEQIQTARTLMGQHFEIRHTTRRETLPPDA